MHRPGNILNWHCIEALHWSVALNSTYCKSGMCETVSPAPLVTRITALSAPLSARDVLDHFTWGVLSHCLSFTLHWQILITLHWQVCSHCTVSRSPVRLSCASNHSSHAHHNTADHEIPEHSTRFLPMRRKCVHTGNFRVFTGNLVFFWQSTPDCLVPLTLKKMIIFWKKKVPRWRQTCTFFTFTGERPKSDLAKKEVSVANYWKMLQLRHHSGIMYSRCMLN